MHVILKAFALTALVSSTAAETSPPQACGILANKDRVGFDLGNVRAGVDNCPAQCKATPGCITWVWSNHEGGTCWLKSRAGKLIDKAGATATSCLNETPPLVCNAYMDIDFVAMDIASRPAGKFKDCCDICNEYPGCTAYAWNTYNNGTCWLKKNVGQVLAKPGVISSSLLPLYGGVCAAEDNTDFVDNDIANKPAADAGLCCGICKTTAGCKAYSWNNYNGGTCWMKSARGKAISAWGVTSGTVAGQ